MRQLALILLVGYAVTVVAADDEYDAEDAKEAAREDGMTWMMEEANREIEVDDTTTEVDPEDIEEGDNTLYLQHMIPGYGTEKNERVYSNLKGISGTPEECEGLQGEAWEQCYEEYQATPAEIPGMAEDHNQQLEEGENPESQAYQTTQDYGKEQPTYQLYNAEDDSYDPALTQGREALSLESPMYESLVGDCESVDVPIYETDPVKFDDYRTCNQVFSPGPDEFSCQAEREFSASSVGTQQVAKITPLVSEASCEQERLDAILACNAAQCGEVGDIEEQICSLSQCDGLEGDELAQCQDSCAQEGDDAAQACETGGTGCDDLESANVQLCITETCGSTPTGSCIAQCNQENEGIAQQCNDDCDQAGEDAFQQCMDGAGEGGTFSGTAVFNIATLGSDSTTIETIADGSEFEIQRTPFNVISTPTNPQYFTYDHAVYVEGGDGEVLSYGTPAGNYRSEVAVTGDDITEIRLEATLVEIQSNEISGCSEFMDTIADGFCHGEMLCVDPSPSPNCSTIGGFQFCDSGPSASLQSVLAPWHSQAVDWGETQELAPRVCKAVEAEEIQCEYFEGDYSDPSCQIEGEPDEDCCYTDADGNERCIEADGTGLEARLGPEPYLDNCAHHIDNPDCTTYEIDECAEGAEGPVTERCYVPDVVFDCGETHWIQRQTATEHSVSCEGDMQCMGTECVSTEEEAGDVRDAASAASTLDQMEKDSTCVQADEDTPVSEIGDECEPEFFRGEAMECKIPIGADLGVTPDCCEEGLDAADDEHFANYMDGMSAAYNAGTNPGEAREQSTVESRDGEQGAHIETPDWMELRDRTIYSSPGDGGEGRETAEPRGPRQSDGEESLPDPIYLDPEALPDAESDEANYVSRPFVTPFEMSAAQHGFTPSNSDELEQTKDAAWGEDEPISFKKALGIGARDAVHPDLQDALFYQDGTPRYVVPRGSGSRSHQTSSGSQDNGGNPVSANVGEGSLSAKLALRGSTSGRRSFQSVASVGKMLSTAYATYALLRAIGHMVYSCEEEEIELGFARQARRCTYVGKYCRKSVGFGPFETCIETREVHCCFNSAFSRIFMEGAREQQDSRDFGTPKEPNCSGLTIEEVSSVDQSQIDLSEWTAMLAMADRTPGMSEDESGAGGSMAGENTRLKYVGTSKGDQPPEGVTAGRTRGREITDEERWSPRRAIPGQTVGTAGPDGMKPTSQRVIERMEQNMPAIEASRDLLRQRGTDYHNLELVKWYHGTTYNPDPPRNPELGVGDDIGDENDEELPGYCSERLPPDGMSEVHTSISGLDLDSWLQVPPVGDQSWANILLSENEYVAIELTMPQANNVQATIAQQVMTHGPEYPAYQGEIAISRCPGYFGDDIDESCRTTIQNGPGTRLFETFWIVTSDDGESCSTIGHGDTAYVNVNAHPTDCEGVEDCYFHFSVGHVE